MDKQKIKTKNLRRRQLDRLFEKVRPFSEIQIPQNGWISEIREALGISPTQMAKLIGLTRQGFQKLETLERNRGITLKSLQRIAEALDCRLVYSLVPNKKVRDLETILNNRAYKVAKGIVEKVSRTMALEDQEISKKEVEKQIEDLAMELKRNLDKCLWEDRS